MTTATFTIKTPPRRMLDLGEAAIYVGVPAKKFPLLCRVAPVRMPDGKNKYDIKDIDQWLDTLKSGAADSDDAILDKLG
ncbi:hypothetical protein HA461_20510 [Rhizobium leguminosarum bv. trifolii]|uniref:hypothetical protein n=1 Tax=Rhizobium leguminosarum TaxID=384 RepID=UPI00140F7930|nr:hypothetical protein [Rhizobium leguminosarum]QIO53405.1 hypothetical protein HA461_20510 [Rhizobium leguminosarum bv. trifolii]